MTGVRTTKSTSLAPVVLCAGAAALLVTVACDWQRRAAPTHRPHGSNPIDVEQSRTAVEEQALLIRQENDLRGLILASDETAIKAAEWCLAVTARKYLDAQDHLVRLFPSDELVTTEERALLTVIQREHFETVEPIERVVALASKNRDDVATQILEVQVLPHMAALRAALVGLEAAQREPR